MEVRLLGAVEVLDANGAAVQIPGPKLRGVLAVLALDAGSTVSASRLAEALWDGDGSPSPGALQVAVSRLRRVLADAGEPDRIESRATGYHLAIERRHVDLVEFESLVERARRTAPDWPGVEEHLERAFALWSGEPLAGVPETEVLQAERARALEVHRGAEEQLAEARLALGRHAELVPDLEALVAAEPLREQRWGLLVRALYGSNRQADALRAYDRARTVLVEEIGVEPSSELRLLHQAVLAQDDAALGITTSGTATTTASRPTGADAPLHDAFRRRGNLRHPVTPCIGREQELAALSATLDAGRLVTLLGPGGVGKTRLAIEVAAGRRDTMSGGVWWVDLAPAHRELDALAAVQQALALDATSADAASAIDALCEVLEDQSVLLVLDNCEQIVHALASAVDELLARCGGLRILATSREPLGSTGEQLVVLAPLAPDAAVELFQSRVAVPIDGDPETTAVVAAICEQLDRLPLALELAAARARHIRLDEMLDRLTDRLEFLRDGPTTAPAHQRSLRAVAEWSYDLLTEPERVVFERLSVFADGATIDAARAVCAGPRVPAGEVEALLHRLVDRSLVLADRSGPTTRFRMLQTLADFAADRLEGRGESTAAARAHAEWVGALARTVGWGARTTGATIAAVHAEDVAIRDAVAWSLEADPVLGLEICDDLAPFWFGTMRASAGWEFLRTALAAAGDADPARRASALAWGQLFATLAGDDATADRWAEEAWEFEAERDDHERLGRLCLTRALAAGYRPDSDAERWIADARRHLTAADVPLALGHVDFAEGANRLVAGDLAGAPEGLHRAIRTFRSEHDHLGLVLAVSRLGEWAWRVGDIELFVRTHADLLELGIEGRTPAVVTGATARLAVGRLRLGDVDGAREMARSALASSSESFMPVINGYAFRAAGLVDLHVGHVEEGRAELRSAIAAFEHGTGSLGQGLAAACWIDLSESFASTGDDLAAHAAADSAEALAAGTGDPWVVEQARANRAAIGSAD